MKLSEKISQYIKDGVSDLLKEEEITSFIESFDEPPVSGLRVNTLKISAEEFLKISPFELSPIPWTDNGFYLENKEDKPGKHPYYDAGLYYLQEPSAMFPVNKMPLENSSENKILDLCAAPGGKSTQLAELMNNEGCLVVNDNSPKRVMPLLANMTKMGVTNAVIYNRKPETLLKTFKGYFSHILIDAPCSGEGMFRRDPGAIDKLGLYSVSSCQMMQRDILDAALEMLSEKGVLVYSTCTFNKIENEDNVKWLKERAEVNFLSSERIWPHTKRGEGQFVSVFSVSGTPQKQTMKAKIPKVKIELLNSFLNDSITKEYQDFFRKDRIIEKEGKMYLLPTTDIDFEKSPPIRPGWFIGECKKHRFEPSVDLALGLPLKAFKRSVSFNADAGEVSAYRKGETVLYDYSEKGWTVLAVEGFPLGWVKKDGTKLKNYYPKNLRRME